MTIGLVYSYSCQVFYFLIMKWNKSITNGIVSVILTGISEAGGTILGMALYGESRNLNRINFIITILSCRVEFNAFNQVLI